MIPSKTIDIDGPVHYLEYEGPPQGPTFVCVHGLGGSHLNWIALAPLLAGRGRVLVLDLPGFGRSPLGSRAATVGGARMVLDRFLEATGATPAILLGNSMGGAISIVQAYTRPDSVAGLVLVAPAVPRGMIDPVDGLVAARFAAYLVPGIGETFVRRRLRALGPEAIARETIALCTVDPRRVPPEIVDASIALARERYEKMPWATGAFLQATRSLLRLLARRGRFVEMARSIPAPVLVLAGKHDRLVSIATLRAFTRSTPRWDLVVFDHLGHVPQLEDAPVTARAIEEWLDGPAARVLAPSPRATEA